MARLIFTYPNLCGPVFELTLEKTTVGRDEKNSLVLRDRLVSRRHCEILVHGSEVIIRDLDSHNGTFVDGVRLNKQSQVKSGQVIHFGYVEARLEIGPGADDSEDSSFSAIRSHGKALRDQRRARQQPAQEHPSMQLDAGSLSGQDEPTSLVRPTDSSGRPSSPPATKTATSRSGMSAAIKYVVIAAVVALGLLVVLWLVWGRK